MKGHAPHPLRDYVIALYQRGELASLQEGAAVAGVKKQSVSRWLADEQINWQIARSQYLARKHEGGYRWLIGKPPKQKPSKRFLRLRANRAKQEWDRRNAAKSKGISAADDRSNGH